MTDINTIPCRGCGKSNEQDEEINVQEEKDFYGYSTGYWCQNCYEHNYPYRKDAYHDWGHAGEYLDDNY